MNPTFTTTKAVDTTDVHPQRQRQLSGDDLYYFLFIFNRNIIAARDEGRQQSSQERGRAELNDYYEQQDRCVCVSRFLYS